MHRNERRQAHELKRGTLTQWHREQAEKIAAAFPLEPTVPIRATGNHLAAQNDEPEPVVVAFATTVTHHAIVREHDGYGLDGKVRIRCACGHMGQWRAEADDACYSKLSRDEQLHRSGGVL